MQRSQICDIEVLGLGGNAIDYLVPVRRFPKAGEKFVIRNFRKEGGGVTTNCLTQLARLGVKVGWIGKIGNDKVGHMIQDLCRRENIKLCNILVEHGKSSTFCWIFINPQGEMVSYMFPNVTFEITPEEIRQNYSQFIKESKILFTEACQLPLAPVIEAMRIARETGILTIFDLDTVPTPETVGIDTKGELFEALRLSDILMSPIKVAKIVSKEDEVEQIIQFFLDIGIGMIAMSLGSQGCALANDQEMVKSSTFQVKVVDTIGAGDAFHGGLIYGLLHKWDLPDIARFANACGAICCTGRGARHMADLKGIIKFLKGQKEEQLIYRIMNEKGQDNLCPVK